MNAIGHEMILASAGAGKTYALTNRFVRLLTLGAAPERIVALTFTRKAAGEFFDQILTKLARAATEPDFAAQLAEQIGAPQVRPAQFLAHLRAVVDAMPKLSLGTLDAFFARIARTFPLELGLAGEFEILEEHSAQVERRRVLRHMFARAGREPTSAQREFFEAFKRATFGADEKTLGRLLDRFIDEHHSLYLSAADAAVWANEQRIWRDGSPWTNAGDVADAASAARTLLLARTDLNDAQRNRLGEFFDALATWSPGAAISTALATPLGNVLKILRDLDCGCGDFMVERKKIPLNRDECGALARLARAVVGAELRRRLEITRGVHGVLRAYDAVYHELVRRSGRLTFADLQQILIPGGGAPALATAAEESTLVPADADARRLQIEWRLDARFEHWLLDEFQDTSRAQWSILRNLIDEVIQDASGRRSFFYVGDVKQAIYGWREGDARLFREIFDRYNASGTRAILERRLDESWRSGLPVLAMVNRVFGNAPVLAALFPEEVATRWSRDWRDHASVKPKLGGHAAWMHAADETARFTAAWQILQEIRPLERGLTTALLVQKNDTATRLADFLRRVGRLPAVADSDLHIGADNPLSVALTALCRAAAHPGDTLAWEHVRMTPLRAVLEREGIAQRDALSTRLLGQIHADGFARTLAFWLERLEPHLAPNDVFSRERGRQMIEAARLFDAADGRSVAEFVEFAQQYAVRDPGEPRGVLRVMTIHKAKGLDFDLVILPDLQGTRLASRRRGLGVKRAADRSVEWVLDLPEKLLHAHDEVLVANVAVEEADACYEELAKLYVAMTRAKRALYVVTEPLKKSQSANFPRLLEETLTPGADNIRVGALSLGDGWAAGDPDWFADLRDETPAATAAAIAALAETPTMRVTRRPGRTPSAMKTGVVPGGALFAAANEERGDAARFGGDVHRALALVEWWDRAHATAWERACRAAVIAPAAIAEARACLDATALAEVFARPRGSGEVWRERVFEIVLDGVWITGVFDRVVLHRDADGKAAAAIVYDFKTDRLAADAGHAAAAAARYAGQLALYRRAAAVLAGTPPARVSTAVVFTAATDARGGRTGPIALAPAGLP